MTQPALQHHALLCHPSARFPSAIEVAAGAGFAPDGQLELHYRVKAAPAMLALPAAQAPGPCDGLWQRTCCEAFVAGESQAGYHEFNLSPSGQWAAYRFAAYRQRSDNPLPAGEPQIQFQPSADGFTLTARLPTAWLPASPHLQLGLTVVIEDRNGDKTYWALSHAGEQADFHLPQSFVLTLTPDTP